jgi:hypothetical protein
MLYRVSSADAVVEIEQTTAFDESLYESQVETWVAQRPEMLGEPLLVIGRQVALDRGKDRIDLLALDAEGALVVIELKRDLIGGDADLQGLRYAALISGWGDVEIRRQAEGYWESLGEERDFLEEIQTLCSDEATLNNFQRLILVGRDIKPRLGSMALWLIRQGIDARVVAIGLLKDEDRVYLQPQILIPPPAEPVLVGAASSKKPWLIDGESWHLEQRCGPDGREILERVVALIAREIPAADPPSWSQKFYISWSWEGRGWAFLNSGPKSAYLELKKIDISPEEAAAGLGYSVFDEEADLKAKLALGSSVARHNGGLRLILKSKDDVAGEKAASLAVLIREAWTQMTGKPPILPVDHGTGDGQGVAIPPADTTAAKS